MKNGSGGIKQMFSGPWSSGQGFGHDSKCGAGVLLKSQPSFRRSSKVRRWRLSEMKEAQLIMNLTIISVKATTRIRIAHTPDYQDLETC